MRDLMYGAALQLTPQGCADKVKPENKPIIAKFMQPKIDALVKLVQQTRDQLPVEGVDVKVFNEQLTKVQPRHQTTIRQVNTELFY